MRAGRTLSREDGSGRAKGHRQLFSPLSFRPVFPQFLPVRRSRSSSRWSNTALGLLIGLVGGHRLRGRTSPLCKDAVRTSVHGFRSSILESLCFCSLIKRSTCTRLSRSASSELSHISLYRWMLFAIQFWERKNHRRDLEKYVHDRGSILSVRGRLGIDTQARTDCAASILLFRKGLSSKPLRSPHLRRIV